MVSKKMMGLLVKPLCFLSLAFTSSCFGLASISPSRPNKIPITVLSGFLGSGKSTLLQNLLQNNEGLRIAVVVNDVASVNIDSKLILSNSSKDGKVAPAGIVELQNGCACCSKSEELLASVAELVTLSDLRGDEEGFQHIVVELSGVADPLAVRAKFQEAVFYDMPLMDRVQLDTMVTLVDCTPKAFMDYLKSAKTASAEEAPELFYREGEEAPSKEEWMEDIPAGLMDIWDVGLPGSDTSGVAELLVSQTETADLVLLNKVDLATEDYIAQVQDIVRAINPRATLIRTKFGVIPLKNVLAVAKGEGVVLAGIVDDHQDALLAASNGQAEHSSDCAEPDCADSSHSHAHAHDDAKVTDLSSACTEPDCADSSHSHAHAHVHDDAKVVDLSSACTEPDCADSSHSHAHSHDAAKVADQSSACTEPDCTDTGHSHSHEHACDDPDCTDASHTHSEASETYAGIGSFVYRARRPFHPGRLASFLTNLPIARGLPGGVSEEAKVSVTKDASRALGSVIRSKGFTWCADSHGAAMYWSQAGSSFDLNILGSWWATLDRSQWPAEAVSTILKDFDDVNHEEGDAACSSVGDRRQEIVFIGPTLEASANQALIRSALDQCLLDDAEWKGYVEYRSSKSELTDRFPNRFTTNVLTY
jgi:G3E family GTPase